MFKTSKEDRMRAISAAEQDQEKVINAEKDIFNRKSDYIVAKFHCQICKDKHLYGGKQVRLISNDLFDICPKKANNYFKNLQLLKIWSVSQEEAIKIKIQNAKKFLIKLK